jgi:hypothetical protein
MTIERNNRIEVRSTNSRRISPIQFLRDRELGIRATNEHFIRQRVQVVRYTSPREWPDYWRRRCINRILEDARKIARDDNSEDISIKFETFLQKNKSRSGRINDFLDICRISSLYIIIPTGIGTFVDILLYDDIHMRRDLRNVHMPILKTVRHDNMCGYYRESVMDAIN